MKKHPDWKKLEQTRDLQLPDWGPYSPETFGISHIHDPERGNRLDLTLLPGFYRQMPVIPDARKPSGGIPWSSSADLRRYSYRQQLEWKDRVYAELEFIECSAKAHLLRCRLVNHTGQTRDLAVQLLARLFHARKFRVSCLNTREILIPELPGRGLNTDAMHPGEAVTADPVPGDTVFRASAGTVMQFHAKGSLNGKDLYLYLKIENSDWQLKKLPSVSGKSVRYTLKKDEIVNRLLVVESGVRPEIRIEPESSEVQVEQHGQGKYLLRFGPDGDYYGIASLEKPSFHRKYLLRNLKDFFTYRDYILQKHPGGTCRELNGTEGGFAIVIQPLTLVPHTERDVEFIVWNGSRNEVLEALKKTTRPKVPRIPLFELPESPFAFSQERMASVIMTNLVYPIRSQGKFIRNHTPGRLWNSLYTWDSGFIGLALLDLDLQCAVENLNAYLTPAGDPVNAFVLHGTPLPIQIFLFYELWNRTCDLDMLRHFYPRVKQMYDYLAGHTPGSTTRSHCTEPMICTWDYFYNSGGWDDYPPQWERSLHPGKHRIIPAVSTSAVIRCAKFLRNLAPLLGEPAAGFDRDIEELTAALRKYSWDPEAGYFSYVTTDPKGKPDGIFRYSDGSNYNMGLDGTSPLFAGAAAPEQRKILWNKVQSPKHLWTPYGISTVDQAASYFTPDGYWNGSVWMPHQWLLWKAALNDGMDRFAEKIASTALRLWERETRKTYACFEQFSIVSGSGMGWHHFSGLSSPVICWHRAFFEPGALTAGYDVLITGNGGHGIQLEIAGDPGEETALIYGGRVKSVAYCGKKILFRKTFGNSVIFKLPKATKGKLEIK